MGIGRVCPYAIFTTLSLNQITFDLEFLLVYGSPGIEIRSQGHTPRSKVNADVLFEIPF